MRVRQPCLGRLLGPGGGGETLTKQLSSHSLSSFPPPGKDTLLFPATLSCLRPHAPPTVLTAPSSLCPREVFTDLGQADPGTGHLGRAPGRCPCLCFLSVTGPPRPSFSGQAMARVAAALAWALALLSGGSPPGRRGEEVRWSLAGGPRSPQPFHSVSHRPRAERPLGRLRAEQRGQGQGGADPAAEAGPGVRVSARAGARGREETGRGMTTASDSSTRGRLLLRSRGSQLPAPPPPGLPGCAPWPAPPPRSGWL